jgi:hypothetical protein
VDPQVDSLRLPNARGPLSSWVPDRLVGIERPLPTRTASWSRRRRPQLALYLCYEPISQEDIQRRDLLPHTGYTRTRVIIHKPPLRPHVVHSVAGTHTDPRRPCVEVEAGGRQRHGQLRAGLCPLFGCGAAATRAAGKRKPGLPEREPAPVTGGEHRGRRLRDRLRGCTAVLVLVVAAALPSPAKSANSLQLSGHRSAGDLGPAG